MRWFRQSTVGIFGDLLLLLPLLPRLLEWVLELRFVRVVLGMANLGQAVDFAIQHLENPGWLGNGWVQATIIAIGLAFIFWDHKKPSWLPSPELSSRQMIIGGLVIVVIGAVIAGVGVWQLQSSTTQISDLQPRLPPQQVLPPSSPAAPTAPRAIQSQPKTLADYPPDERAKIRPLLGELIEILNTEGANVEKQAAPIRVYSEDRDNAPPAIAISTFQSELENMIAATQALRQKIWGDFLPGLKDYKAEISSVATYDGNEKISQLLGATGSLEAIVVSIAKLTGKDSLGVDQLPLIRQSGAIFNEKLDQYKKWLATTKKNAEDTRTSLR
jgi:hypothetical protein